jgi:phytoene dehydrogenase-like protein
MRFEAYWQATAPKFAAAAPGPVEGQYDVAVVGAGFTGLAAARHLAQQGARVVVLEAVHVGFGASSRNGGHVNNGLSHSYAAAKAELGQDRATALYHAFDASVDMIERIVAEENIDCSFRRSGKLKLASKPAHFDAIARNFEALHRDVDPQTRLLSAADLKGEIGSTTFHGGMLFEKSAMMHVGRYVTGLADAAVRHGATIYEAAPVTARRVVPGGHFAVRQRACRDDETAERHDAATKIREGAGGIGTRGDEHLRDVAEPRRLFPAIPRSPPDLGRPRPIFGPHGPAV